VSTRLVALGVGAGGLRKPEETQSELANWRPLDCKICQGGLTGASHPFGAGLGGCFPSFGFLDDFRRFSSRGSSQAGAIFGPAGKLADRNDHIKIV